MYLSLEAILQSERHFPDDISATQTAVWVGRDKASVIGRFSHNAFGRFKAVSGGYAICRSVSVGIVELFIPPEKILERGQPHYARSQLGLAFSSVTGFLSILSWMDNAFLAILVTGLNMKGF